MSYYYVLASLPVLRLDQEAPLSMERFLSLIEGQVKPAHQALWEALLSGRPLVSSIGKSDSYGNALLDAWSAFEASVRWELALMRSEKLSWSLERQEASDLTDYRARSIALEVWQQKNPAKAARLLEEQYWLVLDDMVYASDYFSFDRLIVYFLKLRYLNQRHERNPKQGDGLFWHAYQSFSERISTQFGELK